MLHLNFAEIIFDFIWNKVLDIITYNLSMFFTSNITTVVKKFLSKNSFINEHLIKYKRGSYTIKGTFNIYDKSKSLYTDEFIKINNYIRDNVKNINIIKNANNKIIEEYNIIDDDCDIKINKYIRAKIENHVTNNYIISTIQLYSYNKDDDFINEFIKKEI